MFLIKNIDNLEMIEIMKNIVCNHDGYISLEKNDLYPEDVSRLTRLILPKTDLSKDCKLISINIIATFDKRD